MLTQSLGAPRFDWYEATLDESWLSVAAFLGRSLPGVDVRNGKPRQGYSLCREIVRGDDLLASVLAGPRSGDDESHVSITGGSCDEVVPLFRGRFPSHRVSRVDSAVDMVGDWETIGGSLHELIDRKGLKTRTVTNSDGGATLYVGSATSAFMCRLYKKTEQLRQVDPVRAHTVPDNVVRLEGVLRPAKRAHKVAAAALTPAAVWGCSKWGTEAVKIVTELDVERVEMRVHRSSSWERCLHYLGVQYGPSVGARAIAVGADVALAEVAAALGLVRDGSAVLPSGGDLSGAYRGLVSDLVVPVGSGQQETGPDFSGPVCDAATRRVA